MLYNYRKYLSFSFHTVDNRVSWIRKIFAKHFCNDFHAFKYFAAFRDKSKCGEKVRITSLTHYVLHRIGFKSEEKNAKILNKWWRVVRMVPGVTKYLKYFWSQTGKYFQRGPGWEQEGPGEVGPGGAVRGRHLSGLPGQPCRPGHFLQSKP